LFYCQRVVVEVVVETGLSVTVLADVEEKEKKLMKTSRTIILKKKQ